MPSPNNWKDFSQVDLSNTFLNVIAQRYEIVITYGIRTSFAAVRYFKAFWPVYFLAMEIAVS